MCGKVIMSGGYEIMKRFNVTTLGRKAPTEPRSKTYIPGDTVPAIVLHNQVKILTGMHWGFDRIYNARTETITSKEFWKESYLHRRMIFPISGFYERHWFTSNEPMAAAGIYKTVLINGKRVHQASMLTQPANEFVGGFHPRMPVFIPLSLIDQYLNGNLDVSDGTDAIQLHDKIESLR
jgi:putative SOS response-associated peptidase YedK